MTDERPSTDGGETAAPMDVERAGGSPPDPPTADALERELPSLLDGTDSVTTVYLVRAGFTDGSGRSIGKRLIEALEDKVTVVGSTIDAGFDPTNPELDVLIETDHDHGAIASSLASVGPVRGVVVADVTAAAERELDDGAEEIDAASANDVFNELKEEVGQQGYGEVVDELEDVSFPGGPDPDEEVDLEAATGIDLQEDEPGTLDLDGGGDTLDIDGSDDISTKELLGETDREADPEIKAPDEKAIEEAIAEVELDATTRNSATQDDDVATDGATTDGATSGGQPPTGSSKSSTGRSEPSAGSSESSTGSSEPSTGQSEPSTEPPESSTGSADPESASSEPDTGSSGSASDSSGLESPGETAPAGAPAPSSGEMDAFVAQLVDALDSGQIDEQRRTELREALGIESTHSLDVRLEYLQKRVDNLAAYTDAWEAFLSEQGAGREFMESVQGDLDAIEQRLATLETGEAPAGEVGTVEQRLASIERTVEEVEQRHDDDVTRLDTRVDSVESKLGQRIDAVESGLGTLKEKVTSLLQWREHIDDVLNG